MNPDQIYLRQGRKYSNSRLVASASPAGGTFQWSIDNAPSDVVGFASGTDVDRDTAEFVGLNPGKNRVCVKYKTALGEPKACTGIVVIYPIVLVHGFNSDPVGAWHELSSALVRKRLIPGDYNCLSIADPFDIDFCAVDFCDDCPLGATGTGLCTQPPDVLHPSGSCPYSGTLPFWGSFSSFVDEGSALKTMIGNLRSATGAKKVVILAHSMGGLAARAYIQMFADQDDVDRLITIGTPHGGTALAGAIGDPAVVNFLESPSGLILQSAVNLLTRSLLKPRSPAVQNMSSSPQSGALHLVNETLKDNLPATTQYVSIIGHANPDSLTTLRGLYGEVTTAACFLQNDPACIALVSRQGEVGRLFDSSDGIVPGAPIGSTPSSTNSQDLKSVLPGLANTCSLSVSTFVQHAPWLVLSNHPHETSLVDIFLSVLGLEGSAICPRL